MYELPLPTIAAVNGPAIAGGTGLATICDFTLAVPGAKFGYTEVRIGFVPALVSAFLALQVGDKRARGLLLSGRLFTAEEALGWGLVTEVVSSEELLERSKELANAVMRNSRQAMAATKRLMAEQNRVWLDMGAGCGPGGECGGPGDGGLPRGYLGVSGETIAGLEPGTWVRRRGWEARCGQEMRGSG